MVRTASIFVYDVCNLRVISLFVVHSITIPAATAGCRVLAFFEKADNPDKGTKSKEVSVSRGANHVMMNVKLDLGLTLFSKKDEFEVSYSLAVPAFLFDLTYEWLCSNVASGKTCRC